MLGEQVFAAVGACEPRVPWVIGWRRGRVGWRGG